MDDTPYVKIPGTPTMFLYFPNRRQKKYECYISFYPYIFVFLCTLYELTIQPLLFRITVCMFVRFISRCSVTVFRLLYETKTTYLFINSYSRLPSPPDSIVTNVCGTLSRISVPSQTDRMPHYLL